MLLHVFMFRSACYLPEHRYWHLWLKITLASQHGVDIFVSLTAGLGKCNLAVSNAVEPHNSNVSTE